ncbi:hypothetical protein Lal_00015033 [Lupinus albus]|nr:hypothetical protein Lal_00015033 [Lupinus albus]
MDDVHGPEVRPPALPRPFDEGEAVEPLRVFQAGHRDELSRGRQVVAARDPPHPLAHAPQAGRVEAADDHLPFRDQHAFDFAQYLVRLGRELEHVRQHDEVQALRRERQFGEVERDGDLLAGGGIDQFVGRRRARGGLPFVRHPVGGQRVDLGHADLHRIEAEDVGGQLVQAGLLPGAHDNYLWLIHDGVHAAVVDPGDAGPILAALREHGLTLTAILLTHHHADHIGGVTRLLEHSNVPVFGPRNDGIAVVGHPLGEGDRVPVPGLDLSLRVLDVPGHTNGHIAYVRDDAGAHWLFCGDTLFGGGCGRLFEGTPAQMAASLAKLAALPDDTLVYCAHEYTLSNLRFAEALEPGNRALQLRIEHDSRLRGTHLPTIPSTIGIEKATNPFLRTREPAIIGSLTAAGRLAPGRDLDFFVQRQGQEFGEFFRRRHLLEDLRGTIIGRAVAVRRGRFCVGQFLRDHLADHLGRDLAAIFQHALRRADPLPHLRAADLGRGRVFHQVVDRHAAISGQPGTQVVDAHVDVVAQARFRDRSLRTEVQQVLGRHVDVRALLVDLVRTVAQHLLELGHRQLDEARVRDPAAVVAVGGVACLVVAHAAHRDFVLFRIVLDRDQGRHAADRRCVTLVAGLQQEQRIGAHERRRHGDFRTVGQAEVLVQLELLDAREDVVPAARVQAGAVLAQFVQNLVHFERGDDRLDQHGRLDRALRQAQFVLRHHEDVVPQAGFQVRFHLRQIEVRAGAARQLLFRVVDHEQGEVEDAARDALAVDEYVLLVQVPATRTDHQGRDLVVQLVLLAVLFQRNGLAHGVAHVDLARELVIPVRRIRILEVGHVAVRTRVQRVDDHLALDRARDFHTAAFQRLRDRRDLPVAVADVGRLGQEVRTLAGVQAFRAFDAGRQQLLAARLELAAQFRYQRERFRREDLFVAGLDLGADFHSGWGGDELRHSFGPFPTNINVRRSHRPRQPVGGGARGRHRARDDRTPARRARSAPGREAVTAYHAQAGADGRRGGVPRGLPAHPGRAGRSGSGRVRTERARDRPPRRVGAGRLRAAARGAARPLVSGRAPRSEREPESVRPCRRRHRRRRGHRDPHREPLGFEPRGREAGGQSTRRRGNAGLSEAPRHTADTGRPREAQLPRDQQPGQPAGLDVPRPRQGRHREGGRQHGVQRRRRAARLGAGRTGPRVAVDVGSEFGNRGGPAGARARPLCGARQRYLCRICATSAPAAEDPRVRGFFTPCVFATGLLAQQHSAALQRLDVRCLFAFRTRGHVERNALVLLQRLEALSLDRREVREQVFAAFVRGDEPEAFGVIEPFYDASCHYNFLFQLKWTEDRRFALALNARLVVGIGRFRVHAAPRDEHVEFGQPCFPLRRGDGVERRQHAQALFQHACLLPEDAEAERRGRARQRVKHGVHLLDQCRGRPFRVEGVARGRQAPERLRQAGGELVVQFGQPREEFGIRGSAHFVPLISYRSFRTENAVARIAQPRHDVGVVVQLVVERRHVQLHARMRLVEHFHAFRRRDEGQEDDLVVRHAALLQHVDGVHGRVARRDHRIAQDERALGRVRQAHEVFDGQVRVRVAEHADVAHPRRRHQFQQPVAHAHAGAQDRHDGQLLARDDGGVDGHQRRVDRPRRQRQVARDLVAHQQRDLPQQFAERARGRAAVAHVRQLMLDQGMVEDEQRAREDRSAVDPVRQPPERAAHVHGDARRDERIGDERGRVAQQQARLHGDDQLLGEPARAEFVRRARGQAVEQARAIRVEAGVAAGRERQFRRQRIARLRPPGEGAQHVQAHHVAGPFPDRIDGEFAVQARQRAVLDVTVAAHDFHRFGPERGAALAQPVLAGRREDATQQRIARIGGAVRPRVEAAREAQRERRRRFRFQRQVGQHVLHQWLLGQRAPERAAPARMVQRVAQRGAHDAGRAQHAIEARVAAHFEDRGNAASLLADQPADGVAEFHFGRRVRLVAKLVLQPLDADGVARAVRQVARHEETGEAGRRFAAAAALFRLRQHEVRVRLRDGEKPFVADEAPRVAPVRTEPGLRHRCAHARGARRIRAHVRAALLFRHAHADQGAVFPFHGQRARVVGARQDLRQPVRRDPRMLAQRGHGRVRHRDRALRAVLDLAEQQVGGRPRDLRAGTRRFPRQRVGPVFDQQAHQLVPRGVELDLVHAVAAAVEVHETRREFVGQAAQVEHAGCAQRTSEPVQVVAGPAGPFARDAFAQRRVAGEQVDVTERRRLVENLVGIETVHGAPSGMAELLQPSIISGAQKFPLCTASATITCASNAPGYRISNEASVKPGAGQAPSARVWNCGVSSGHGKLRHVVLFSARWNLSVIHSLLIWYTPALARQILPRFESRYFDNARQFTRGTERSAPCGPGGEPGQLHGSGGRRRVPPRSLRPDPACEPACPAHVRSPAAGRHCIDDARRRGRPGRAAQCARRRRHGGRPRARRGAAALRRQGPRDRTAAAPHGHARRADGTAEPPAAVRPHPHGDRQRAPLGPGLLRRHDRPRRLQESQRRPWPSGGRRRAAHGRRPPAQDTARQRHARPRGWRRVRRGPAGHVHGGPDQAGERPPARRAAVTVRGRRAYGVPGRVRGRVDLSRPRGRRDPPDRARRRRHGPREGNGQGPRGRLQRARKRAAAARHLARGGDVPGRARRRIPAVLPADRLQPHAQNRRVRDADAVEASDPGHGAAGALHPHRGDEWPHQPARRVGAEGGARAVAPVRGSGQARPVHLGQHQPAPVPQRPLPERAGRRARLFRHARRQARARDHGRHADGRPGARRSDPRQDGRAQRAHRDRRLRHRLFEPRLPEALPDLGIEDRPRLHQGLARVDQGRGDLQCRARPRQAPGPVRRGRRRRDRRTTDLRRVARMRLRTRLPDREADAGPHCNHRTVGESRRHPRPAVGADPPARRHARLHEGHQRHPRVDARRGRARLFHDADRAVRPRAHPEGAAPGEQRDVLGLRPAHQHRVEGDPRARHGSHRPPGAGPEADRGTEQIHARFAAGPHRDGKGGAGRHGGAPGRERSGHARSGRSRRVLDPPFAGPDDGHVLPARALDADPAGRRRRRRRSDRRRPAGPVAGTDRPLDGRALGPAAQPDRRHAPRATGRTRRRLRPRRLARRPRHDVGPVRGQPLAWRRSGRRTGPPARRRVRAADRHRAGRHRRRHRKGQGRSGRGPVDRTAREPAGKTGPRRGRHPHARGRQQDPHERRGRHARRRRQRDAGPDGVDGDRDGLPRAVVHARVRLPAQPPRRPLHGQDRTRRQRQDDRPEARLRRRVRAERVLRRARQRPRDLHRERARPEILQQAAGLVERHAGGGALLRDHPAVHARRTGRLHLRRLGRPLPVRLPEPDGVLAAERIARARRQERRTAPAGAQARRVHAHVAALGAVHQRVVDQHQRQHRFRDRRRADAHARVVAAERLDHHRVARPVDGAARRADRRRRLDRDGHRDVLARRNPAQHTTGVVADEALRGQFVAVFRTLLRHRMEAGADFDALHGIDAHHGVGDVRVELVVDRLAEAHRHVRRHDVDAGADGIAGAAQVIHRRFHARDQAGVGRRREERVIVHVFKILERHGNVAQLAHAAQELRAELLAHPFFGDGAGADDRRRQARGRAAAAARIAHAVLVPVCVVRMAGTERVGDVAVVLAALVRVLDQQRDRRARRDAFVDAGQDPDLVGFLPLRHVARRARLAAVQLRLDVGLGQRHPRRATVDHAADCGTVRFAESGYGKQLAKCVAGHGISLGCANGIGDFTSMDKPAVNRPLALTKMFPCGIFSLT